jgi:N-acetylglucosamine-6-sulfatase
VETRAGDDVGRALDMTLSRRTALRSISAGTLGALAALGGQVRGTVAPARVAARSVQASDTRPNIILLVLDDMRADDLPMMPAVQELLVAQGTNFSNFFATAPGCAPARASILRGQYPHNHGVRRSDGDLGGFDRFYTLDREQSTVATWLQDAGYRTALIGKYFNGYPNDAIPAGASQTYVPAGWDEWAGVTNESYFQLQVNENGRIVRYGGDHAYGTDVLAAKALAFVEQAAHEAEPFFLYLTPRAPHGPAEYAPRHATAFADVTAPRPPSFNEADVSDKPAWMQAIPVLTEKRIAEIDAYYVARLRTLLAVDEMVAALVESLRRAGTLDSTYILLTSDNGYHLGEHRIVRDKGSPYEESIRVPLVVRGPGVPVGETRAEIVSQVDLAPTFAAWADAAVPDFVDGRSLASLLAGEAQLAWRQTVLIEKYIDRPKKSMKQPRFDALRGEDFTYVENFTGSREWYDLTQDPYQVDNLVASVDADRLEALSDRLAAMTACARETCRTIEDAPLPPG